VGYGWFVFDPFHRMLLVLGQVRLAMLLQQEMKNAIHDQRVLLGSIVSGCDFSVAYTCVRICKIGLRGHQSLCKMK